jgi:hypothetical protein
MNRKWYGKFKKQISLYNVKRIGDLASDDDDDDDDDDGDGVK